MQNQGNMNIFNIKEGYLAVFFTVPCLFFSQVPGVECCLCCLFFLLLGLYLVSHRNQVDAGVRRRHIAEVFLLAAVLAFVQLVILAGKDPFLGDDIGTVVFAIYLAALCDLANCLANLWGPDGEGRTGKVAIIFLCLLLPFLGCFHLKKLHTRWYVQQVNRKLN